MSEFPKHRRFSFSLRTLFVLVTLVTCWLGYHLNWMRQRREAIAQSNCSAMFRSASQDDETSKTLDRAPWPLGLFGERGAHVVILHFFSSAPRLPSKAEAIEFKRIEGLFPEANVFAEVQSDAGSTRCNSRSAKVALPSPPPRLRTQRVGSLTRPQPPQ